MAASHVRWVVGWSIAGLASWGFWIAFSAAEPPVSRSPASRVQAGPIPLTPAVEPLRPLEAAPVANTDASETTFHCVVLYDGRVFEGKVIELPQAYQVRTSTGALTFPFDQVRTVASSLPQAYTQLRESYEHPNTNDHISLGQWCAQNKLYEEASLEAQAALVLDPGRTEALSLLKKAEEALGREPSAVPQGGIAGIRTVQAGAVVSAEAQLQFSRQINRIALNKCGNGACHGPASFSPFKLTRASKSDSNLQAILKYINIADPEMSDLLVQARSVDGPHKSLFQGAKGREQYAAIQAWVVQVSNEQNNLAGVRKRPTKQTRGTGPVITIRPKSDAVEDLDAVTSESGVSTADATGMELRNAPEIDVSGDTSEIKTVAAEEEPATSPAPRPKRSAPLKSETIQKLLKSQDPDAFDPEEFNRLVHGDRAAPK